MSVNNSEQELLDTRLDRDALGAERDLYRSLCATQEEIIKAYEKTIDEIEWLCDGRVDIDNNGGPNLAMQIISAILHDSTP